MLTQDRLKEVLHYDPSTGEFTWRNNRRGPVRKGARAGALMTVGYESVGVDGSRYYSHRLAWLYMKGVWPTKLIDHRNHNKRDNRFTNLREGSNQANSQNMTPATSNLSGLRGVCFDASRCKWSAKITVSAKTINLGRFDNKTDAHAAYLSAKAEHHPFYNSEERASNEL